MHIHTLITNHLKRKTILKNNSIYNNNKKYKIPRKETNKMKDMYTENYNILIKDIKEKKERYSVLIRRLNSVKISILPEVI